MAQFGLSSVIWSACAKPSYKDKRICFRKVGEISCPILAVSEPKFMQFFDDIRDPSYSLQRRYPIVYVMFLAEDIGP